MNTEKMNQLVVDEYIILSIVSELSIKLKLYIKNKQ